MEVTSVSDSYICRLCRNSTYDVETSGIRDWEFGVPGVFEYRRCTHCSLIQIHPMPTIDELASAYPDGYSCHIGVDDSRGLLYSILHYLANRRIYRDLKRALQPNSAILDVGCGDGDFAASLRQIGAEVVVGVDFNETASQIARSKGIEVFHGLFLDFEAKSEFFDAIFMNNYLEHVTDPVAELRHAAQLLKNEGLLVGEAPNFASLDRRLFRRYWGGNHVPRHTFQYDPDILRRLLLDAGFSDVRITHEVNSGTFALSIQNFFIHRKIERNQSVSLRFGRTKFFVPLLLASIPFSFFFKLIGLSGVMKFRAEVRKGDK